MAQFAASAAAPEAKTLLPRRSNDAQGVFISRCLHLCESCASSDEIIPALTKEFGEATVGKYKSLVDYYVNRAQLRTAGPPNSTSSGEAKIDLPRLVACLAGCGYWGKAETKNLCNKCYSQLQVATQAVSDRLALEHMLMRLGFSSLDDYKLDMVFEDRFPAAAALSDPALGLPGVSVWQNAQRPLTQFDKAPERGTTACTFVSGVTALRAQLRGEYAVDSARWSDCILRGVVAYHSAAQSNPSLKGYSHISEALPYAIEVLGYSRDVASKFAVLENIVILFFAQELEGRRPSEWLGDQYCDSVGTQAVAEVVTRFLSEHTALVITRPPETWSVTRSEAENNKIRFRDSHRRQQYDFESVEAFVMWITTDQTYFAPVPGTGIEMNSVSVSAIVDRTLSLQPTMASFTPVVIASPVDVVNELQESKRGIPETKSQTEPIPSAPPVSAAGESSEANLSNKINEDDLNPAQTGSPALDPQSSTGEKSTTGYECTPAGLVSQASAYYHQQEETEFSLPLTQIDDRVFISGRHAASDPSQLRNHGITHLLNVSRVVDGQVGNTNDLAALGVVQNYQAIRLDADPRVAATDMVNKHYKLVSSILRKDKKRKLKILIYCDSGVTNSATLAVAWILRELPSTLIEIYINKLLPLPRAIPDEHIKILTGLEIVKNRRASLTLTQIKEAEGLLAGALAMMDIDKAELLRTVVKHGQAYAASAFLD